MSEQTGKPQELTEISIALSVHYRECSIPASGVATIAHRLATEQSKAASTPFIIHDHDDTPTRLFVQKDLGEKRIGSGESAQTIQFILATDGDKQPRLCARFDDDSAVQIAAFEKRKDDRCNYIQLGQEHADKNYILTTADHSRLDYVLAILDLLKEANAPEQSPLLAEFALEERAKLSTEITDYYQARSTYKELMQLCEKQSFVQETALVIEADDIQPRTIQTIAEPATLSLHNIPDVNGRTVDIVFFKDLQPRKTLGSLATRNHLKDTDQQNIRIGVRLESDVLLPLYTLSCEDEREYTAEGLPISEDEQALLGHLLKKSSFLRLRGEEDYLPYRQKEIIRTIHELSSAYNQLILSTEELENPAQQKQKELEILVTDLVYRKRSSINEAKKHGETGIKLAQLCARFEDFETLQDFCDQLRPHFGENTQLSIYLCDYLRIYDFLARQRQALSKEPQVQVVSQPFVQEKIRQTVGEYNPGLDALKARLQNIFDPNEPILYGTYLDYPVPLNGKVAKADIAVQAEIHKEGHTYTLYVTATLDGLQGKGELLSFKERIDLVQPNDISSNRAAALADILKVVAPPERKWLETKKRVARRALGLSLTK